ncbi:uncharacterized protein LOC131054126 [Cryptomeria japonica]|uniref:uncharacterized protein LOC131054126 n=1 Tax=Cryptomeria japonica TaxID=3369 RepID=UPI0025AC464A|nr:uncharacterized protein LOC131054126 [Cryptomeria japonica]
MASSKTRSSAPVLHLALQRSLSPTRHSFAPSLSSKHYNSSPVITFDLARSVSPKRNLQARSPVRSVPPKAGQRAAVPSGSARKMCLCSPSNHPGAFRCSLHRNCPSSSSSSSASTNSQLHMRRSAMKNSLVRIGSVEGGEWMKKALSALIRPSSHQVRRRTSFQPQPSRLCHMTRAEDAAVS